MSASAHPSLLKAHSDLICALAKERPRTIVGLADAGDIHDLRDHMLDVARAVDAYVLAIGGELKSHAPCPIDMKQFTNQTVAGLDGNATFEFERVLDRMGADAAEFASDRRGWAKAAAMGVD